MKRLMILVVFAWLAASAAGCNQDAQQPRSPVPSSVSTRLVAQAPVIGKTSFGRGVRVNVIRSSWLFSEARIVDETLYVMYYTQQSSNQQIASLSQGVSRPVLLSHAYGALTFENDNRLISGVDPGGVRDWYMLRGGHATEVPGPASPRIGVPRHVLTDGDSCADGIAGSGSALDEIRAHHRVSILTNAAMSRATNGALARAIGVYCDHFHGKNYATMDAPGIIFRLDGEDASIVSAGWIEAASDRHLLIQSNGKFIEAEVP